MTTDLLRYLGATLTLAVGTIHLQQYLDGLSNVPTIGELFLLNAAGAGAIAIALATRLRDLAAVAGITLAIGSIVAILVAMGPGLFDYMEPTWRGAVVLAVAVEAAATVALVVYLASARRSAA